MHTRALVAIALILLPGEMLAQRIRPPRVVDPTGGPVGPVALPPQAPTLVRELSYRRLRLSVESYPLVSYIEAPGFAANSPISSWTTLGAGTRMDYRVTRNLSATLDFTSSVVGGPANTQTVELGTRLRPERSERRIYPFVDLRAGYVQSYNTHNWPNDIYGNPAGFPYAQSTRFSQGFGGLGGVCVEYALSRMFSLTSSAAIMRTRMTSRAFLTNTEDSRFWMTTYRYTLGLRFNPVRAVHPPVPPYPSSATPKP